ncbi:MAG: NAD-dependent dehydratase [Variovorax paradoxus]|nr:MAG: NAD-dependent dehydratase [Variovorax paradoxus]PZQ04078.1 MAG: NAD-dependent dehydratase [Variovorax paradoxus]
MNVLLTGASGFVGAHLLQRLAARPLGQTVVAVRKLPHQSPSPVRVHVVDDAAAKPDWSSALLDTDAVVHLAARAHLLHDHATDPLAAYRDVNTAGTLRLAEQAAGAGVRRFVFVSTAKVHGESTPPSRPFTEAAAPAPGDPYALSKWEAEQGLAVISARTGMEVVVVRPPLVYGPHVKANFAALMRAVARGWPLPLAAIDNRRSLVGLDNLVDFLLLCLDHPAAANQTFLVSDGEDLSTPALLRRLGSAMGRPARLWTLSPTLLTAGATLLGRRAAAERLCGNLQVDTTKARTLLNWSPPVSVDEGLRRAAAGLAP